MVDTVAARGRRERSRARRAPRHRAPVAAENFIGTFTGLGDLAYEGARVSASVVDLDSGRPLVAIDDRIVLPTAGIGKVLLLIEVSARLTQRDFSGYGILDKSHKDAVGGRGVWQHLQAPSLPVADLASLVGATSDNVATNALLREVGLPAVRRRAESLGLSRTAMLDIVRATRGPDDAPQLSVGSTAELAGLFGALARGEVVDSLTSSRVLGWLSLGSDFSMVSSAFGLDPLAHRATDHGILLVNKTGLDEGVRAEVGVLRGPRTAVCYSVTIQFNDANVWSRLRVLDTMRTIGFDLLEYVH
ncbi:serine hydrolase [Schumannella soli]|uniref:Serine hydrolase n=1 Tax=Schumannella soli TaxID=2590779 RepID=A0A506Y7U6_9MICO|nr:serine hydrolase [Schumannella soli]